ncbi:MAG: alpha/beta fold hydrolase [Candidatus Limnocylindrales bacterium]
MQGTVELPGGATLRFYDTGPGDGDGQALLPVFWHHGTPNIGLPPKPLFPAAKRLGIRWLGYDRPGYGGSTRRLDRDVASAADDVARIADHLGLERFGVVGHSGGSPHALACAAWLPDRVLGAVLVSTLAPFGAAGLDYFADMIPSGVAALQAARQGREAKEAFERSGFEYDPEFTAADLAALKGPWKWFGKVVGSALERALEGPIDDDLAYVSPWGFEVTGVLAGVMLVHGGQDRIAPVAHARWMAAHLPSAELRVFPDDGHISALTHVEPALQWLAMTS